MPGTLLGATEVNMSRDILILVRKARKSAVPSDSKLCDENQEKMVGNG